MRRIPKILLIVAGSLVGLVLILFVAALIVLQTQWFRDFVKGKIIAAVEESTGGRTEIGAFKFSWTKLRAEVDHFVLHGKEGPQEPPLLRAKSLVVGLKILSVVKHSVDIDLLKITQPQVYAAVYPDGSTNFPSPKVKKKSNKDPIQTIMDLAVRHFAIEDGLVQFSDRKMPLNVRGDNLRAKMLYDPLQPAYGGTLAMSPIHIQSGNRPELPVNMNVAFGIRNNRIDINSATFDTPQSKLAITGDVANLSTPQGKVKLNGRVVLEEIVRSFGGPSSMDVRRAPPLELAMSAGLNQNTLNLLGLQVGLGKTQFDASGVIGDIKNLAGKIRFDGRIAVDEVGRIMRVSSRPGGLVVLGGEVRLAGAKNYTVAGKIDARDLSFQAGKQRIAGINAVTQVNAGPDLIALRGIHVAALGGRLNGNAELANMDRYRLDASLNNFDLKNLASRYASKNLAWDGIVSGPVHVRGALKGNASRQLVADARLGIRPGPNGIPVSGSVNVNYDGPRDTVNLGNSFIALPHTRLNLSGSIGQQLRISLVSRNLNDFLPAIAMTSANPPSKLPVQLVNNGVASFDGTVTGSLSAPRIDGHLGVNNFVVNDQRFDRFAADINAQKTGAAVRNAVLAAKGMQAQMNAAVGLRNWKPEDNQLVNADFNMNGANVHDLLAAAGKSDTNVTGVLNVNAKVTGTVGDPRGVADLSITKGMAMQEPFDRIAAHVDYGGQLIRLTNLTLAAPAGRIDMNAAFQHPPKQFQTGRIEFHVASSTIQLDRLPSLAKARGLRGTLSLRADGAAALQAPAPNRPRIRLANLNANIAARNVTVQNKPAGNLNLVADTRGQNLTFRLDSDLANSNIHGNGNLVLAGDYPLDAKLTFGPVRLAEVRELVASGPQQRADWDGEIDGSVNVSGPVMRPDALRGMLELSKLEVGATPAALPGGRARKAVALRNDGPIVVTLDRSVVRIQRAHLTGTATDFTLAGAVNTKSQDALDLHANGTIGLQLIEVFNPNVFSSGRLVLTAAVKGPMSAPAVNGRLELKNASLNMLDVPNGLSDSNGVILFSGTQAVIQDLTGTTGGGKIRLTGAVRYGAPEMSFRLMANAREVRIRYPNGASTQVNADFNLAGTSESSFLNGNVVIQEVAFHSHTDFGSILSQGTPPPSAPQAQTGMLGNMRLDIRIDTAPDVVFDTPVSQNLQADAHLRVRGTPSKPGILGRVNVTQGDIVFFGSKYTIDQGTVSFYNPQKIEPVLNIDLSTKARGVDVALSVSGPMDNLKLTYHSDPPLPFSDIVQLLASGKTPTSDPVLAAQQPPQPQQSLEQMGASALLEQAVANPVSGRLQRLFGVTKLKIDPQILGAQNTPQARLTLQQQITKDLSFTYIQDVTQSNPQVIQIEWAIDPTWSAVALRQENGQFGLDLFYKKRFR